MQNDDEVYASRFRKLKYLKTIDNARRVLGLISKVFFLFLNTRNTVAQKAIQEELNSCAVLESVLLEHLYKKRLYKSDCSESVFDAARKLNIEVAKVLRAFIKAAKYDLNYLEQYVEQEFWHNLSQADYPKQIKKLIEGLDYEAS